MQKILTYCSDRNTFLICVSGVVLNLVIAVVFFTILNIIDVFFLDGKPFIISKFNRYNLPLTTIVLAYIIIGPLLETLISQYASINIFQKFISPNSTNCILFSALVFALFHYQSPFYMIYAFLHGLVYATMYLIFQEKGINAYLYVFASHLLFNLLVGLPNFFK